MFVRDRFIKPYIGDVLLISLLYSFAQIFLNNRVKKLYLYIFIIGVLVEILQFRNIASLLKLSDNKILSIVVGSAFDWKDIICYFVGMLLIIGGKSIINKVSCGE